MNISIKRVNSEFDDLPLPTYATEGSAGMDIYAATELPIVIEPGAIAMIPTNISIALQPGYECQVRSRSGLAGKNGMFALNAPGTVDSDYRGEVKIILANFGKEAFTINKADRIAQLVIAQYEHIQWKEVSSLDETERGSGGFGSTGVS